MRLCAFLWIGSQQTDRGGLEAQRAYIAAPQARFAASKAEAKYFDSMADQECKPERERIYYPGTLNASDWVGRIVVTGKPVNKNKNDERRIGPDFEGELPGMLGRQRSF